MKTSQGGMEELKCPVCLGTMLPPITLCENDHNICGNCRPQLDSCPKCGGALSGSRNLEMEKASRLSMCAPSLPATDCYCPFFSVSGVQCPWSGKLEEVKKHVTHSHDKKVSERSGKFSMVFTDVSKHASYTTAISALGEVFMRKAQIRDEVFYLTVMYVGPLKNSAKYKFTFTLSKKNAVESVTVCQRTRSFTENCDDVFRSRNCVKLHYDVVSDFMLDNNDLPNVMEITRV